MQMSLLRGNSNAADLNEYSLANLGFDTAEKEHCKGNDMQLAVTRTLSGVTRTLALLGTTWYSNSPGLSKSIIYRI